MGQLDSVQKTVWLVAAQPEQHGKKVWPLAKYTPGNSALKHYIGAGESTEILYRCWQCTETLCKCWGIHRNIIQVLGNPLKCYTGAGNALKHYIGAGEYLLAPDQLQQINKKGNNDTKDFLGINCGALIKSQGSQAKGV